MSIVGPTQLTAGQRGTYVLRANIANPPDGQQVGFDLAAQRELDSTLHNTVSTVSGESTQLWQYNNEITAVPTLKKIQNGTASYQFYFTMPSGTAAGSTRTLNAVAAVGVPSAGVWNHAPEFTVTALAPPPPPNPYRVNVTLVNLPPAYTPIGSTIPIFQSIGIRAETLGGKLLHLALRTKTVYSYRVNGAPIPGYPDNAPQSVAWYLPQKTGYHTFSVTARVTNMDGTTTYEEASGQAFCGVTKVTYVPDVVLSGGTKAPPSLRAVRLSVRAALPSDPAVSNTGTMNNVFSFALIRMGTAQPVVTENISTTNRYAVWTPSPPQPATPGTYTVMVYIYNYYDLNQPDVAGGGKSVTFVAQ